MSQFAFEQELASAVRLDQPLSTKARQASVGRSAAGNTSRSNASWRHNSSSSAVNRSRSESRLHPQLANNSSGGGANCSGPSPGRQSRKTTPTRRGNSLLDLSSIGGISNAECEGWL